MTHQQQKCSCGRLLERFEQRIRRRCIHGFRGRDQSHLGALPMRRQLAEFDQFAHALDVDRIRWGTVPFLVVDHRFDKLQVGMGALSDIAAARAHSASLPAFLRRIAKQGPREMQRQQAFAQSPAAADQQRVRPALPMGECGRSDRRLPQW